MTNKSFHQARWNEPIILEQGSPGERGIIPPAPEPAVKEQVGALENLLPAEMQRTTPPRLPELSQMQVLRHFLRLSQETLGADLCIDIGLGTCTMKYSPKIHEQFVRSPQMAALHPYQDENTVQGMLKVMYELEQFLKEISGMDRFSLQPAGGTQAIYTNAAIVRAYHHSRGEGEQRDEVITTILSHPGNAGAASTAGFKVLTLMPGDDGLPDIETLKAIVSQRTAALLITNPEDTGIFNPRIKEFVDIVHEVGGLCVYDQANLNGLLGISRAREAGFDLCHYNLHKTFSSPHGCQGPGAGALGATEKLARFLPVPTVEFDGEKHWLNYDSPESIGKVRKFYGVPAVMLRAYAYILSLGAEGLQAVAELSILNNNYLVKKLLEIEGLTLPLAPGKNRLDQARFSWQKLQAETGVGTDDINRRIVDYGLQSYFTSHHPRIIPEPFTPEPPETYSKADIDKYVEILRQVAREAYEDPELVRTAPHRSTITKIDTEPLVEMDKFACTWRAFKKKR
ncbi:MAG: glycine dehydrogenase subunit 2 [Firmicutes bacterium]|nr:glycine dehydrogenase subunit 2 [Bacillota bacterium]